ncbi:N-6 DNA methylase [Paenibacillus sp. FSL R7-0198]|uniref:HsdM family class I SAM-dependent methyltransferase n=1 Tax=Paenibacillus sp. FSL R7-0198 TaxID=2921674 RepID=UPI0030FBAF3A
MYKLNKKNLEKRLNSLLDLLWRNGISGSEESVDFIIFLLLFKKLDTSQPQMEITWTEVRESLRHLPVNLLIDDIRRQIEQLAGHGLTGPFYLNSMGMLLEAMELVEDIVNSLHSNQNYVYIFDILGSTISKQQRLTVFTPLRLANTLVRMNEVNDSDILVDPACGMGNFLIASLPFTRQIRGFDNNAFSIRLTNAKLYLCDFTVSEVSYVNSLERGLDYAESQASVILTNPPFSMKIKTKDLSFSLKFTSKQTQPSEIMFLWRSLSILKPGGRGAIVLPESFFFSDMYVEARHILFKEALVDGVISLPRGMFKSSAQLKTSVLLFRKKESRTLNTEYVWFYEMDSSEFSQTEDYYSEEEDTYQTMLSAWFRRNQDADQWFKAKNENYSFRSYPLRSAHSKNITFASFNEIVNQKYLLSVTNYSYIEPEPDNYGDPQNLLSEVLELEEQITEELRHIIDQTRWIADQKNQEFPDDKGDELPTSNESALKEKYFHELIIEIERKERKQLMNMQLKIIKTNLGWFLNELADWQLKLLYTFFKSHQPLAAHEAAKRIIGVQSALQTILLFESFGVLERTLDKDINIPSYDEKEDTDTVFDRQGNPLLMDRWQPAISYMEGENL